MAKARASKKVRRQRGSAGCMAVIALVFFGVAGVLAFNTWSFHQRAETVEAIVIDLEVISDDDGTNYRPTFGFPGPDGPVEARPKVAAADYDYGIGDAVEIRYDPRDPTHAIPTGTFAPWMFAAIAAAAGAIPLAIALLTFIASARTHHRQTKPKVV